MTPRDIKFDACGCCADKICAEVVDGERSHLVTDNTDGTYSVVTTVGGLFIPGSKRIVGPDDEI